MLVDGDFGFRGVNTFAVSSLLQQGTLAGATGVITRSGVLSGAPTWRELYAHTAETILGAGLWSLEGTDRIVIVLPDRILVVDMTGAATSLAWRCAESRVFMTQAEEFFYIQGDNTRAFLEYRDGAITIHTLTGEWNGGYAVAYAHGRLWTVPRVVPFTELDGRRFLIASDVWIPSNPHRLFDYTEGAELAGGGAIAMATELGTIKGLCVLQGSQGRATQLVAITRRGACAIAASVPRDQWGLTAISAVVSMVGGALVEHVPLVAGNDVLYRASDGWRSLAYDSATRSNLLASQPLTVPVSRYLAAPVRPSVCVANGYVLLSDGDTNTLLVGDALAAGESGSSAYAWQGRWFAPYPCYSLHTVRVDDTETACVVTFESGRLRMYVADFDANTDNFKMIVTRTYNFNAAFEGKKLYAVDLSVTARTKSQISVFIQPDMCGRFYRVNTLSVEPSFSGVVRFLSHDASFVFTVAQIGVKWDGDCDISAIRLVCDPDETYRSRYVEGWEATRAGGTSYSLQEMEDGQC